ncbi:transglutaminase family protein [Nocardioides terrisoli]|uniref:transglutaminase family protein n=1 Tax=Nocardioides terrisoli TaxID=3388267 RepID=UPI00287BC124|nr:DUF3488 and transglutaminase-like domain-containing protein [Nocardioides marmorisolisilvae]
MTGLAGRVSGVTISLLAMLTTWAAVCSWRPLVAAPHSFLLPALLIGGLVALVGAGARAARLPTLAVPVVQLVVAVLAVAGWFHGLLGPTHWWPTPSSLTSLFHVAVTGSEQLNTYASPVPVRYAAIAPFLTLCALGLVVVVDLCACGLRRVPLAGLPLLLALTVPISVLDSGLALWVFLLTGALFVLLLGVQHTRLLHGWGREVNAADAGTRIGSVTVVGGRIGAVAIVGAVLLPVLVPVSHGIFNRSGDHGSGNGDRGVTLVNPMIDIRRDLIQKTHTPMVDVRTDDPDPSYLQLTVLDAFTGSEWRAANRSLPAVNRADGALPTAPGIAPDMSGATTRWTIRMASTFETRWLPVPVPTISLRVPGDWRFDTRTLDVVNTGRPTASEGLIYHVRAFAPTYDANVLNHAGTPVGQAVTAMTDLPAHLPPVIARVARRVTRGATTEYQQAVALQDWFRTKGGFTYSTAPAPGSGMDLLAKFVTTQRIGYCEQFAAAMAVMGRTLGIPSRVVVGFLRPSGPPPGPGQELFTSDDLHAWPEFYFAGSGWVTFEPTPSPRTGEAPAYTRQRLSNKPETLPTQRPQPTRKANPRPRLPQHAAASTHHGSSWPALAWLLGLAALALLCSVPRAIRSRQRRSRMAPTTDPVRLARGAWQELRATAIDHGVGWADRRSPRQALSVLRSRVTADPDLVARLEQLTTFIERARYARAFEIDENEAEQVRHTVGTWSAEIAGRVSPRSRRRARWWPPSLVDRGRSDPVTITDDVAAQV